MWYRIAVSIALISNLNFIFSLPAIIEYKIEETKREPLLSSWQNNNFTEDGNPPEVINLVKTRVKRAKGKDKFSEAAEMSETRMFQMYLQLFKNLWVSSYVGGGHPLHPDVPKPVLRMYKERILSFFFPPVGQEPKV